MPGFLGLLHGYFQELQLAGVDPHDQDLMPWFNNDQQVRVLVRLYAAYLADLRRFGWQDKNGLITAAGKILQNSTYNPGLDLVVIDGFDRFSRPQRDLITRLSALKTRVLVTLTGEPDSDRLVYRRTLNTLRVLRSDHPNLEVLTLPNQSFLPPALKGIERGFLNEGGWKNH